jgi:uncharacterized membrane protein YuzA (DUF378 family)
MQERSFRNAGIVEKALLIVAIIGAVNWGLIGFFNWNLVDALFGGGTAEETSNASRIVYAIVGLAGLVALFMLPVLRPRSGADYDEMAREARSY